MQPPASVGQAFIEYIIASLMYWHGRRWRLAAAAAARSMCLNLPSGRGRETADGGAQMPSWMCVSQAALNYKMTFGMLQ